MRRKRSRRSTSVIDLSSRSFRLDSNSPKSRGMQTNGINEDHMTTPIQHPTPKIFIPKTDAVEGSQMGMAVIRCYCNQENCSGVMIFDSTLQSGQSMSYTVWRDNGANGRTDAVVPHNQTWEVQVQTGDTWSSAIGSVLVPVSNPRNWCWVDA